VAFRIVGAGRATESSENWSDAQDLSRFCKLRRAMPANSYYEAASDEERTHLESLIRADFQRCHPGDTLEDLKRRASFSKEDKGLLRDWMAIAIRRAKT